MSDKRRQECHNELRTYEQHVIAAKGAVARAKIILTKDGDTLPYLSFDPLVRAVTVMQQEIRAVNDDVPAIIRAAGDRQLS